MSAPVHLLKGSDPVQLAERARAVIDESVGDAARGEVLDEFTGDDYDLGAVVLAASTVSMFGARVVVARNMARFPASALEPLLAYLADPSPDTTLVLVWDRPVGGLTSHPVPRKLADAVTAAGGTVEDCGIPGGRAGETWFREHLSAAGVSLNPQAERLLRDRLGEDLARLGTVLRSLEAAFGLGAGPLDAEDVEPYLGEAGGVPPWELTDAIDRGDVATAVTKVRRMVQGGGRHPLQVLATLETHVTRLVRLDGARATNEKDAAALLGLKGSTFPARKALEQSRALGSARVARALHLLARADVDLRGRSGQPAELVLEVLVARLAALSSRSRPGR